MALIAQMLFDIIISSPWNKKGYLNLPLCDESNTPFQFKREDLYRRIHFVPLNMKGCICHFTNWQTHTFIPKGTIYLIRARHLFGICAAAFRFFIGFIFSSWSQMVFVILRAYSDQIPRVMPISDRIHPVIVGHFVLNLRAVFLASASRFLHCMSKKYGPLSRYRFNV